MYQVFMVLKSSFASGKKEPKKSNYCMVINSEKGVHAIFEHQAGQSHQLLVVTVMQHCSWLHQTHVMQLVGHLETIHLLSLNSV